VRRFGLGPVLFTLLGRLQFEEGVSVKGFPPRAWAYSAVVSACSGLLAWWLIRTSPVFRPSFVLGFAVLFFLAELAPVALTHASYSVGFVVAIAAIVAGGPGVAALASAVAAFDVELRKRSDWLGRLLFNGAQVSLATGLAGVTYRSLGGRIGELAGNDFPSILVPLSAATFVYFLSNVTLVSIMVRLVRRVPMRELWHSDYRAASLSHFSFAVLGLLLALLYINIGVGGPMFLVLPLLVARSAFHASTRTRVAFEATLRSLVTAIEAKDLYTRGHAERVSRLAEMIARQSAISEAETRRIRYAALMHDVGKLTVDTRILQKPGKLTPDEFEHMKIHPIRGAEIVSEVEMLSDMVDGVRHHHERLDGAGYPDGLFGSDLSVAARIIMVADAFDSMTSTRSYRRAMPIEKAIGELRRCQGTQFAPEMIDALERALETYGWNPTPEEYLGEATPRPEVSVHAGHA
jgi:HD-GYP domain-containing protein (c-di-GMP phosphodiesterase class II)